MSKQPDKNSLSHLLTLEDLIKGIEAEVELTIPEDRFAHLPNLAGHTVHVRPLSRSEFSAASAIAEKQGYPKAVNMLVFRALISPKPESVEQMEKAVGGLIDWLAEEIYKISGMYVEAGSEEEKNSTL